MRIVITFIISFCIPTLSIAFINWSFNFIKGDRITILILGLTLWVSIESYYLMVIKGK
jgi:hypothetical protein